MASVVVLGSTGSIGAKTLELADLFGIEVEALSCRNNVILLNEQVRRHRPKFVCIGEHTSELDAGGAEVFVGEQGIFDMLSACGSSLVMNSIVGFSGVGVSLEAQRLGKTLILANKESLVVAGHLVNVDSLVPVDSEHFGIWHILRNNGDGVRRMYITASGGALRDMDMSLVRDASISDVLAHPNWSMGDRITVDSATMVNKLYETLEAHWLFKTLSIDAVIERSSRVHAMVEFSDGSMYSHMSNPDMRLPIGYALDSRKARSFGVIDGMRVSDLLNISFKEIDIDRYPLWRYKDVLLSKPHLGVVLNASNEYVVERFLSGTCRFDSIEKVVHLSMERFYHCQIPADLGGVSDIRREVIDFANACV